MAAKSTTASTDNEYLAAAEVFSTAAGQIDKLQKQVTNLLAPSSKLKTKRAYYDEDLTALVAALDWYADALTEEHEANKAAGAPARQPVAAKSNGRAPAKSAPARKPAAAKSNGKPAAKSTAAPARKPAPRGTGRVVSAGNGNASKPATKRGSRGGARVVKKDTPAPAPQGAVRTTTDTVEVPA